nr:hypothetical protein [Mycoplasmopsis agalactiae]
MSYYIKKHPDWLKTRMFFEINKKTGYTLRQKSRHQQFADVFLLEVKMDKQLSVNEWKYLFEKYEKHRSGKLTKKCFLNEITKTKKCKAHF